VAFTKSLSLLVLYRAAKPYISAKKKENMLPNKILLYLNQAAKESRTEMPHENTSLFEAGILDSFSLVEFVTLLENEFGIRVTDAELRPETFETMEKIEAYIAKAGVAV
jgi:acyl carrier protein